MTRPRATALALLVDDVAASAMVRTPADVDAKHQELAAAGYESLREPWDAAWGHRYATVLDPDGNNVDLYAGLPQ